MPLPSWSDLRVGRPANSLAAMVLALVAVGLTALGLDFLPLRLLFGLPLVFVLPGLVVVNAFFSERPAGGPEKAVLILAVSLGWTLAGALLLNRLPMGLDPLAWAGLSAAFTLVFGVVHLLRPVALTTPATRPPAHPPSLQAAAQLGAALVIAAGAVWLAHLGARQAAEPFTQLWLLPEGTGAQPAGFELGFQNMENEPATYDLRVTANDQVLVYWTNLHLAPGEVWEARLSATPDQLVGHPIEASLYRQGELYRWVNWQPNP